VGMISALDLHD